MPRPIPRPPTAATGLGPAALVLGLALAMTAGTATTALAAEPPLSGIIATLEADGYIVTSLELEGPYIEVEAVTPAAAAVELRLDRRTGARLEERAED